MDDIESATSSPKTRKRAAPDDEVEDKTLLNLKGTQFLPTPPDTDGSSNASPPCTTDAPGREGSPAPSSSALSSVEITSSNVVQNAPAVPAGTPSSSTRPAKRRKLTPAEKDLQKKEKDAKDAERAIQKAKREEEKRVKDEEKRKKAEDRDAKKREKEVEEERKAQEKLKKERAQMRLGAFFQKPATPIKQSDDGEGQSTKARRKSLSLEPFDAVADLIRPSQSPCRGGASQPVAASRTPAKPIKSDYKSYFLPFVLKANCSMASADLPDDPEAAQGAFDRELADPSLQERYDLGIINSYDSLECLRADAANYVRGAPTPSTRQLVDQIQGTLRQPVDLTKDETPANPMAALQAVQQRYLEFPEDVRPPYFGTYSKIRSPRIATKLRRAPMARARPDTDYDYDSEAEWEEPDEGDDECVEDEDEAESQGDANEMDEFLDDEEDAKNKRKMITGDLVPASTGLCWEDKMCKIVPSIECDVPTAFLNDMRIGVLLPGFSGTTIDPFSTEYWDKTASVPAVTLTVEPSETLQSGAMAPPRPPLQPRTNTNATLDHLLVGAAEGMKGPITSVPATQSSKVKPKAPPKALSKEDLDEFKDAVVGSQLSKADILKGLKARYDYSPPFQALVRVLTS